MPPLQIHQLPTPPDSTGASTPCEKRPADHLVSDTRPAKRQRTQVRQAVSIIPQSNRTFPRSQYASDCPTSAVSERQAINELRTFWNSEDHADEEYNIWKLEDFSIYRTATDKKRAHEFAPLHYLNNEKGVGELLFDGILTVYGEERRIRGALFDTVTVDGYHDQDDTLTICIQSELGAKANVWFQLGAPADEYVRYYEPYLWIARLGKYFVEYLTATEAPTLAMFRHHFYEFVSTTYPFSDEFRAWSLQYRFQNHDYRQPVCAYIGYLRKECYGLDKKLFDCPLWGEADPYLSSAIPLEPPKHEKTVVTQFVFECFQQMAFSSQLVVVHGDPDSELLRQNRRAELNLTPLGCKPTQAPVQTQQNIVGPLSEGDVVCVEPDRDTRWKTSENARWYAYVQGTRTLQDGVQKLDVIWLYEPCDTTLGQGHYPFKNELFFSDNCSCGEDALEAHDAITKVDVKWFVDDPGAQTSFFVRRKFRTEHTFGAYDFVRLEDEDFHCQCSKHRCEMEELQEDFKIGDTVLVRQKIKDIQDLNTNGTNAEILEPAEIMGFLSQSVILRRYHRCDRDLGRANARMNEITPTEESYSAGPEAIIRKCRIAVFASRQHVVPPFDRDGAGDLWFVIDHAHDTRQPLLHEEIPNRSKLKGMGLFCGGGSFDRGIEEGGSVTFKWAVDWDKHALHTYRANLEDINQTQLFLGSVNDYISKSILGISKDQRIANVGEVEMIAAGSPCPGFSKLQRYKQSEQSMRNCSLVASVCAYVDHYMPLYLVLENVVGMAESPPHAKNQNAFSQILCCLVSMGYQVRQFLVDPSQYGSCQSRPRIFIVATAPNLDPPESPPQTHSSPQLERAGKSIGRSSNGLAFGRRRHDVSPFPMTSAKDTICDLPNIQNGHIHVCIEYPDHRLCGHEKLDHRSIIRMIPRSPPGQGFMQSYLAGHMSQRQIDLHVWTNKIRSDPKSRSWSRIFADRLIGCLTTTIQPHDALIGRILHYEQDRPLTVMEARRIQSIPDNEVVVGVPRTQWKVIGNGVDRKVAFALGLTLAKAWKQSLKRDVCTMDETEDRRNQETFVSPSSASTETSILSSSGSEITRPSLLRRLAAPLFRGVEGTIREIESDSFELDTDDGHELDIDETSISIEEGDAGNANVGIRQPQECRPRTDRRGSYRSLRSAPNQLVVTTNFSKRPERAKTDFL